MRSNKKSSSSIKYEDALRICELNNIKVYPINKNGYWYIQVNINGSIKTFDKKIGSGLTLSTSKPIYDKVDWCKAIKQTILFYAEKFSELNTKS